MTTCIDSLVGQRDTMLGLTSLLPVC